MDGFAIPGCLKSSVKDLPDTLTDCSKAASLARFDQVRSSHGPRSCPQVAGWLVLRRHHSPRTLTLNTGKITARDGSLSVDCTILDFSGNGACVLVSDAAEIPSVFLLSIDGTSMTYSCVVRWRTRSRIGLAFEPACAALDRVHDLG
jgi:PilZ domain-containing protein